MNPFAELKKVVEKLRAALILLDEIHTPELARPDVRQGDPVTEELAHWAIRVYAYSILCQFREMLRSALLLFDAGEAPAVFLCCRAMFEMAAHSYYVKKHVIQHLDKKDLNAVWDFLLEINAGSRHMKERQKATGVAEPIIGEGPHIAKVIACFDEYFKGERKNKPATDNYSFLSEFCHPNSFAFTNHIDSKERKAGVRIKFIKPSPEICIQVLPDALFSCWPLLSSMSVVLSRARDDGFNKATHNFAAITAPEKTDLA